MENPGTSLKNAILKSLFFSSFFGSLDALVLIFGFSALYCVESSHRELLACLLSPFHDTYTYSTRTHTRTRTRTRTRTHTRTYMLMRVRAHVRVRVHVHAACGLHFSLCRPWGPGAEGIRLVLDSKKREETSELGRLRPQSLSGARMWRAASPKTHSPLRVEGGPAARWAAATSLHIEYLLHEFRPELGSPSCLEGDIRFSCTYKQGVWGADRLVGKHQPTEMA